MTNTELQAVMAAAGCTPIFSTLVLDREYACPALDYIQKEFSTDFWNILCEEGLTRWVPEVNDCDNFALRAMDEAQKAHMKSKDRDGNKGLAFGCFFYAPEAGGGVPHCINFAIIRGADGTRHPVWFEPQTYDLRNLTQKERESCFGYFVC